MPVDRSPRQEVEVKATANCAKTDGNAVVQDEVPIVARDVGEMRRPQMWLLPVSSHMHAEASPRPFSISPRAPADAEVGRAAWTPELVYIIAPPVSTYTRIVPDVVVPQIRIQDFCQSSPQTHMTAA
ncbi:hypothetical protein SVAN01_06748 [Stagonosporopsis vannaccii]|nr:hypothetical protein SVAN01_06748 [Stagonosporopsis vannaccii]